MLNHQAFEFVRPNRSIRELKLLDQITANPNASQRELGRATSLTAAMVNQYILEFSTHGFIEVEGETNRTLSYRMTDSGRARRRHLADRYMDELVVLHTVVMEETRNMLHELVTEDLRKAAILGANAKAALLCSAAEDIGVTVTGIYDDEETGEVEGYPVQPSRDVSRHDPDVIIDCRNRGLRRIRAEKPRMDEAA